jgi:hypothetical protein
MGPTEWTFVVIFALALGLVGTLAGAVAVLAKKALVNPQPSPYGFGERYARLGSAILLGLGLVGAALLLLTGNWRLE